MGTPVPELCPRCGFAPDVDALDQDDLRDLSCQTDRGESRLFVGVPHADVPIGVSKYEFAPFAPGT